MGHDIEVYCELLKLPHLRDHQLEPLARVPDELWSEMASALVVAGRDPRDIAQAAFAGIHSFWGPGLDYWTDWAEAFKRLEADPRPEIRDIARHGRRIAEAHLQHARDEQRQRQLYGT